MRRKTAIAAAAAMLAIAIGMPTAARAMDERRVERAAQALADIIDRAKTSNSAHPNMIMDLENVLGDLRDATDGGYGRGGGYGHNDDGYGRNDDGYGRNDGYGRPGGGFYNDDRGDKPRPPKNDDSIPARNRWRITGDMNNISSMQDKNRGTRADTGTPNYGGRKVNIDLGKPCTVRKVIQDHGASTEDYPRQYKIMASPDGMQWNEIWRGKGTSGHSVAEFSPVFVRFIRVEATEERQKDKWWSIHELGIE